MKHSHFFSGLVTTNLLLAIFSTLGAQSIWLEKPGERSIGIEVLKADFDNFDGVSFATSTIFLSGRTSLANNSVIVAEIPFSHLGVDDADYSETVLGNPYLGLELRRAESAVSFDLGLRPPLASNDFEKSPVEAIAVVSDFDRADAFLPETFSASSHVNYKPSNDSNVGFRLRAGPTLWISTGDNSDTELLMDYAAQITVQGTMVGFIGGITGRLLVTEDNIDFADRTVNQVGVAANLNLGNLRPGVHLRLPLDDELKDAIDMVFGLHLGVQLQ